MADNFANAEVGRRRWVDTTINIQQMLIAIIGAVGAAIVMWYTLEGRVSKLEQTDREHERLFSRVESDLRQQRDDVKEQLRNISDDVKNTNQKLDELTKQLLINSAGNRPDIRRWSK